MHNTHNPSPLITQKPYGISATPETCSTRLAALSAVLHSSRHLSCMYFGLRPHSPASAHALQLCLSTSGCSGAKGIVGAASVGASGC